MSKRLEMIRQELEKLKKKRTRLEEQIRELEEKYQETENAEIHEIVHAANLTPEQLAKLLKNLQQGLPQGKLPAVVQESTKKQDEKENGGENSNEA